MNGIATQSALAQQFQEAIDHTVDALISRMQVPQFESISVPWRNGRRALPAWRLSRRLFFWNNIRVGVDKRLYYQVGRGEFAPVRYDELESREREWIIDRLTDLRLRA